MNQVMNNPFSVVLVWVLMALVTPRVLQQQRRNCMSPDCIRARSYIQQNDSQTTTITCCYYCCCCSRVFPRYPCSLAHSPTPHRGVVQTRASELIRKNSVPSMFHYVSLLLLFNSNLRSVRRTPTSQSVRIQPRERSLATSIINMRS